jgi:hypothetical protein
MSYRRKSFERNRDRQRTDRCGPTRKVRFASHEAAFSRAGEILDRNNPRTAGFRAYQCNHCLGWHLTSQL